MLLPQKKGIRFDIIKKANRNELQKYENRTHSRKMFGLRGHKISLPLRFRFSTMSTPQTTEFYTVGQSHNIVQILTGARREERRW